MSPSGKVRSNVEGWESSSGFRNLPEYFRRQRARTGRTAILPALRTKDIRSAQSRGRCFGCDPLLNRWSSAPHESPDAGTGAGTRAVLEGLERRQANHLQAAQRTIFLRRNAVFRRGCCLYDPATDGPFAALAHRRRIPLRARNTETKIISPTQISITFPAPVAGLDRQFDQVAISPPTRQKRRWRCSVPSWSTTTSPARQCC